MMENLHRQCSENYADVEFYSTNPVTPLSQNHSQNWKNQVTGSIPSVSLPMSIDPFSNNNNHLSSNSDLNSHSSHHGFSINVSTGVESDLFIDELIELADESMTSTSSATSSSVMSTPSPVMVPQSKLHPLILDQHPTEKLSFVPRSSPAPASAPAS